MRKLMWILVGVVLVLAVVLLVMNYQTGRLQRVENQIGQQQNTQPSGENTRLDYKNLTYSIGKDVKMSDGYAEEEAAPGSASKIVTRIQGEPVWEDIDQDGVKDALFFVTQETGGSGTFWYVAAALSNGGQARCSNGILIGDRIVSQNIAVEGPTIKVNYLDRSPSESMADTPTLPAVKTLKLTDGELVEQK